MNTIWEAEALVDRITGLLGTTLAGDEVHVTSDALTIAGALADGKAVVAIQPPNLKFPPPVGTTEADWELYAIAGPYADMRHAWARLDLIITTLAEPLNLDSASTATYEHPGTPGFPAYVLTFTETY